MNPEFGPSQPPADIIEVGSGEELMSEELETMVAAVSSTETVIALYDPLSGIGYMGRYTDTVADNHDIKNLFVSAKNLSDNPDNLHAWAVDIEHDPTSNEPVIVALDCVIGYLSVDGRLIEPSTRIF